MVHKKSNLYQVLRPFTLASGSARRKDFLRELGINCEILIPPVSAEPLPGEKEDPACFAARSAEAKALAVQVLQKNKMPILAADTVVYCGNTILGKPRDREEALDFLRFLSGRDHFVRTACLLLLEDERWISFFGEARVSMAAWPDSILAAYAASGEGLDKAGAYAVQGLGAFLVEKVQGSWSSVIGLPVAETVKVLLAEKIIGIVSLSSEDG